MARRSPLIGIPTAAYTGGDKRLAFRCYALYAQAVSDAGGAPVLIPLIDAEPRLHAIYEHLDGLLFTGGADVNPRRYGEYPIPQCTEPDDRKDHVELRLARWALEDDKPLLAICRGMQILNVAAGGTLYQDLEVQVPGALDHHRGDIRAEVVHTVDIAPGGRLEAIVGPGELGANSSHHQAVKDIGHLFVATARASDGVIEGMEAPSRRFAVAVQWHPEELYGNDDREAALFRALIEAATA
jgi:putative glutamine amidotransferase